jgi:thiamine-phosphate pyrophosphorylase
MIEPFYPIVPNAAWAHRMICGGATFIQIRIKSDDQMWLGREIRGVLGSAFGRCAVVINDHWQLAIELNARWVHLGQEDLEQADVKAIRRAGIKIGISTHSEEELENALLFSPDYIALGPIYETTLKEMPWEPQGLNRLAEWRRYFDGIPLVAIGGMTLERADAAISAGADSVAMVSDITQSPDPNERVRAWLEWAEKTKRKR